MQESEFYYYNHNGQTTGPIAVDDLKRQIKIGAITPNDQICRVGDQVWTELSWSEFSDLIPPPPPLPPPMKSASAFNEYTTNPMKVSIGRSSPAGANFCYVLALLTFLVILFFPLPPLIFILALILLPVWIIIGIALTYLANMSNRQR